MAKMYRILQVCPVLLLIANYSFSQQTTGEIAGNILSGNKPVSGASILASTFSTKWYKIHHCSNNKGLYRLPNMRVAGLTPLLFPVLALKLKR